LEPALGVDAGNVGWVKASGRGDRLERRPRRRQCLRRCQ